MSALKLCTCVFNLHTFLPTTVAKATRTSRAFNLVNSRRRRKVKRVSFSEPNGLKGYKNLKWSVFEGVALECSKAIILFKRKGTLPYLANAITSKTKWPISRIKNWLTRHARASTTVWCSLVKAPKYNSKQFNGGIKQSCSPMIIQTISHIV